MLFDPRDRALASGPLRQPPPLPELPPDGAIGEMVTRMSASWEAVRAIERSNSRDLMLADAMQPFLDAYERETGQELENPYFSPENPTGPEIAELGFQSPVRTRSVLLSEAREKYDQARAQPGDRLVSTLPALPSEEQLRQSAIARAQNAEDRAERAAALSFTGAGTTGAILGTLGSAMRDPINLASLFFGAPGGAGILRTMAVEAGVGAGTELLMLPQVRAWKRELGKDPGFADAAANVAIAGIGAGAFAGLIKGSWQVVRPLLTRDQRAAVHVADAMDTLDRRDPFELARRTRMRAERTGQAPAAAFADELRAGVGDDTAFHVELDRLARELDAAGMQSRGAEASQRAVEDPETTSALQPSPTIERTAAGDQLVVPGAERITQRDMLERRIASRDVRRGQQGLEGLELFDPTSRARQGDLLDAAPVQQRALHTQAVQEAEASLAAGEAPDGPAIRAIDSHFAEGELELPVWEAKSGKGRTVRWRGPMDIVTWARTIGGLKDDAGELKSRDLQKLNRGRQRVELAKGEVFLGKLVNNDSGISLDEAALRAWEAGYFPGMTTRPTTHDLLDALDRTVRAGNDVDRRVFSEQDAALVDRVRARVDPDAEEHARRVLGDELVDEALDMIDGMPVLEEPIEPEIQALLDSGARALPDAGGAAGADEAERITFEALADELAAGDFRVTQDILDASGNVAAASRSAREVWQETEAEAAGLRDAAGCLVPGAADAA